MVEIPSNFTHRLVDSKDAQSLPKEVPDSPECSSSAESCLPMLCFLFAQGDEAGLKFGRIYCFDVFLEC